MELAFYGGDGSFVRQVICAKYGEEEGGWKSCVVRGSFGVGLWKSIRRVWDVIGDNMVYYVGNGRRVRFWKDKWCGDDPLRISFPSLFAISLRRLGWRMCGATLEGECGLLSSQGSLTIGRCSMWNVCS